MEFDFTVRSASGQVIKGRREAGSQSEMVGFLRGQNLTVVKVSAVKTGIQGEVKLPGFNRVTPKQVTLMSRQLATLQSAGVPLLGSLTLLSKSSPPALAAIMRKLAREVETGSSLSGAMAQYPRAFDDFFVKLVYAGEQSGNLDVVFDRIAVAKEKSLALAGKIKSAMTYPIAVLVFAMAITYFLLTKIVPQFAGMLTALGGDLPVLTKVLIAISDFLVGSGWVVGLILVALGWTWRLAWRRPKMRFVMETFIMKIPIFGQIRRLGAVSIFARTSQTLMSSGVNIIETLSIARDATGSLVIGEVIDQARAMVVIGEPMSSALRASPLIDPMVVAMVEVGEETGRSDEMLGKVADIYDREVDEMVDSMSALIEPMMIVFLGAVVGSIVAGMFLPMFAIINQISGGA